MDDQDKEQILNLYDLNRVSLQRRRWAFAVIVALWRLRTWVVNSAKRALDIIVGLVALILVSPIMLLTVLLIKLESPGPAIFAQTRVGKWGRTFTVYKFRSMYMGAEQRKADLLAKNEASGPVFKMKHDPRLTRVGRVIRKLSIDELPQLLNVLRGEMSLVGPRPPVPSEVAKYEYDQRRRLGAIPGMTGLQQVSGRSDLDFDRWVALDVEYIEKQSFWYDIKILIKTIPAVLFGRGAY